MPLSFVRSGDPRIYIPGYKSSVSQSAFNAAIQQPYANLGQQQGGPRPTFGAFDQGQLAKIESGRFDLNANQLVSMAVKQPAYAIEAPLRPASALLDFLGGNKGGQPMDIGGVPVLGNILDGIGDLMMASDKAGGAAINYPLATVLAQAKGKPDSWRAGLFGSGMTAGEARRKALLRWGTDMEGNQYTLEDLEARAISDPWSFGQFATSEDGITDFLVRGVVNPINLAFTPGIGGAIGAGARGVAGGAEYLAGAAKAAPWARPIIKATTPIATPFRYGYGYAASMGRGVARASSVVGKAYDASHNPLPRNFIDVTNAAHDVAAGNLARSGYFNSVMQAAAWGARGLRTVARKTYLPGLNTELRGARLAGDAARAYVRGGLQQEAAMVGAEYLVGELQDDEGMPTTFIGGTAGTIHDILQKINNQHPLSDSDGFVMVSLFAPWGRAAREIVGEPFNALRAKRLEVYGDNLAAHVHAKGNELGAGWKTVDDMYSYIGDGDIARGKAIFTWFADHTEVRKTENQLSHLTQQIADAEIDGMAERMAFIRDVVMNDIMRRRHTGALQPRSTADYMYELHKEAGIEPGAVKPPKPGEKPKERGLSSETTPTAYSLADEMKNLYSAFEVMGPQLHELGFGLAKGGILSRETMQAIINHFDQTATFDVDLARRIIDGAPSLVYHNEFWREFSITLGREQKAGIRGRSRAEALTEGISREDLRTALVETMEGLPSTQELFHEAIRMSKTTGRLKNKQFEVREPPYHMGEKMQANMNKIGGRIKRYGDNDRAVTNMRRTEYFKNGQPKFGAADNISSETGQVYRRRDDGGYFRDDGVGVNIEEGAIRLTIPPSRITGLLTELDKTLYRRGPRRGQIKPGMEEASQQLNLDIEAARMGIDRDALLLATQHGGRVIVADPMAGPWLARHGYVESARIEHRYPQWIDPGERPQPSKQFMDAVGATDIEPPVPGDFLYFSQDGISNTAGKIVNQLDDDTWIVELPGDRIVEVDPANVKSASNGWSPFGNTVGIGKDEAFDIWMTENREAQQWMEDMTRGVMRGDISVEAARARGWDDMAAGMWTPDRSMQPLPDTLYHATTNIKAIKNTGIRTKDEMGHSYVQGLGGGPGNTVSWTDSLEVAKRINETTLEMAKVLRGEIPLSELVARAKKGGWLKEYAEALGEDKLAMARTGKMERTEMVPDKFDEGGGVASWRREKRTLDPESELFTKYDIYNTFLKVQSEMGGPLDPVIVLDFGAESSYEMLQRRAQIQERDLGILKAKPASSKALGMKDVGESYLHEWKVIPETLDIEGVSDAAAYSFRGGDPAAIRANAEQGAYRPYRPTRRIERTEQAAIGVARGDARRASMLMPSDWQVGPAVTPETSMFPQERLRSLQEQTRANRNAYRVELGKANKMNDIAFSLLPFDNKVTEMSLRDWVNQASASEVQKFTELMTAMEQFPNLSLTRDPRIIVDPTADRFTMLNASMSRTQRLFLDYGPLSPITRFYDALLAPKHARWLGKQTQTEVHNLLTLDGWTPAETRNFMGDVRQFVLDSRQVTGFGKLTGAHMFPSVASIPENNLRAMASRIAGAKADAIIERYGSYQHMFTQASNRLLRTTERKYRSGVALNPIEKAADAAFRTWQYEPGFRALSGGGQRLTKFTYPYFRFFSDPLFAVMNWIEPYAYNVMNDGWRGLRKPTAGVERRSELASAGLIPPGGLYAKNAPIELLLADPGFYTIPRNIRPNLEAEFGIRTTKQAELMFESLSKNHPIAQLMRERFGDDVKDWAAAMNSMMENLAQKGPEHVVRTAWKQTLEKELGFTQAELKQLAPVAERLTEVYRGVYSDMADLYIGRMNRSNLERMANNYFLFWPISYMVKVTAWAYRVMMEKIGPVQGNAGAYLWDQYRQRYENKYDEDGSFRNWLEDNEDFVFAAEMLLPITPASIGVSLNKTSRYAGNWLLAETGVGRGDELGSYEPESIPEALSSTLRFGPVRTYNMAADILKAWEVPGFYKGGGGNPTPGYAP